MGYETVGVDPVMFVGKKTTGASVVFGACAACVLLLVLAPPTIHAGEAASAEPPLADPIPTGAGVIAGDVTEGGAHVFKGIPFAAPPVGELRWRPPRPPVPWDGVRACMEYAPACPQPDASSALGRLGSRPTRSFSEDCLYLNVWAPSRSTSDALPVMVWFHGGSFTIGTASDEMYNGENLARRGAVVVTTNYRLGPLGFMAHPLLSKESERGVSGNYGLLDQIAALTWVRENIRAFGGDPGRVTIFGESAGGRSVAHLMVTPLSKGLFHSGIMQSSSLYRPIHHLREPWYGRPGMETVGEGVAERLGCDQAEDPLRAMRESSAEEILEASDIALTTAQPGNLFEPIVDGRVIPDVPSILPNGPGLPRWLVYDATDEPYMELGDQVLAKHHLLTASCDLFEKILEQRRANRSRPED